MVINIEEDLLLVPTAYHEAGHAIIACYLGMTIDEITVLRNGSARINLSMSHFTPIDDLAMLCVAGRVAMKILFQQDVTLQKWPIANRKKYKNAFYNCERIDYQLIYDEFVSRKGNSTEDAKALAYRVMNKARPGVELILRQPVYRKMLDVLAAHIFEEWRAGKGVPGTDVYSILYMVAVK